VAFESAREMAVILNVFFARRAETMCEPMVPLAPTMAISLRCAAEAWLCTVCCEGDVVALDLFVRLRRRRSKKKTETNRSTTVLLCRFRS
jgi:hypothetical protein